MSPTLEVSSLRRPYGRRIVASLVVAGLVCLLGCLPLLIALIPSEPCPPGDDAGCGPEPTFFLLVAAGLFLLGVALAVVAGWFAWRRSRLLFVGPPGWPSPPAGWTPPAGWEPDAAWPAAPEDWDFWRRGGP